MTSHSAELTFYALLEEGGAPVPIDTTLVYDARNPMAVTAAFDFGAEWAWSRDLMVQGMSAPAGAGAVRIRPEGERYIRLELRQESGTSILRAARADLEDFLAQIEALVPDDPDAPTPALQDALAEILAHG